MADNRRSVIQRNLANADANAQMVGQIGGAVAGGINSIMQHKAEEPARRAREAELARVTETRDRESRTGALMDEGLREGLPGNEIAYRMEQTGLGREGQALRAQETQKQRGLVGDAMTAVNAQLDVFGKASETTAQIAENPALYAKLRPQLSAYASALDPSGKLAAQIPQTLTGGPEQAAALHQTVTEVAGSLRAQQSALGQVEAVKSRNLKDTQYHEAMTKAVANALILAPDPDARDAALANFGADGIDPEILNQFTGKTPKQINTYLLSAKERADQDKGVTPKGDFEEYANPNTSPERKQEIIRARRAYSDAGREPNTGGGTGDAPKPLTAVQKNVAERDYQRRLDDTEQDFRRSMSAIDSEERIGNITPEEAVTRKEPLKAQHEADKARAQRSYYTQIGYDPASDQTRGDRRASAPTLNQSIIEPRQAARPAPTAPAASPLGAGTAAGSPAATVLMRAPDGTESQVPANMVRHYESMGAKVVRR
ncbi:MAG: hypothetical protein H0W42_02940 [Gemmatimonadaceae bacterium]|nr:hypothetical protein [Gemmatimonadaceae bacterium]